MNVMIAPDSFKGSATAKEVTLSMRKGILNADSNTNVHMLPMADGGEGTMINLVESLNGEIYNTEVEDPFGRPVIGEYGIINDKQTAVIEVSSASGLSKLAKNELDPYTASTYGTGQLILNALNSGIRHFIICLGGSATNDGGAGILKALGFQFLDEKGNELRSGGRALKHLKYIDTSKVEPSIYRSVFDVACDVNNPLVGTNGASTVFGPQKGATPKMIEELDKALTVFGKYLEKNTGSFVREIPGSGAAGGAAGGLLALLNTKLKPGIQLVMETVHFEEKLRFENFDLLLTGEGKIDSQTDSGKLIAGISKTAREYWVPTIAITGAIEGKLESLHQKGLIAAFSIVDSPMSLQKAMEDTCALIEKQTEQLFRLMQKTKIY